MQMYFQLYYLHLVCPQQRHDLSALVLSCLNYCNAVLASLFALTLAPLQIVSHASARIVLSLKQCDYCGATTAVHW